MLRVVFWTPVAIFVAVITTPGINAFETSDTVPVNVPVRPCEKTLVKPETANNKRLKMARRDGTRCVRILFSLKNEGHMEVFRG